MTDTREVTKSTEDYLEAILVVKENQGYVRSIDVATELGVTKPSVSYATKKLKENGYITMDKAGMIVLTEAGAKIAEKIYTRHKTLSQFFMKLGVAPQQALDDACLIEHDISEETFQALCSFIDKTGIISE